MRIDSHDLHGVAVVTEMGRRLGKVLSFEIDIESHAILLYHVGTRNWAGGTRYIIAPDSVLSITTEQMTVRDSVIKTAEQDIQSMKSPLSTISPVASRQE